MKRLDAGKKIKIDALAVDIRRKPANLRLSENKGAFPRERREAFRPTCSTACPGEGALLAKINPLNAYKETKIRTASQGQLIIMIYDEAIKQIDIATASLEEGSKRFDEVHNAIVKAQDLVTELTVSLDMERGGEIAKRLFSLYMFFREQLSTANVEKSSTGLSSIRSMLAELRDAWVQICKTGFDVDRAAPTGVNIAG